MISINPADPQSEKTSTRHVVGLLWLILFVSESLVMGGLHFFNIQANVWHGLLVDSLAASVLVVGATCIWLRFCLSKTYKNFGIVVAKITTVVFAAEGGLMIAFHVLPLSLSFWQEGLLDAFFFSVMGVPIIYYWAILPADEGRDGLNHSIPIHTSITFAVMISFSILMLDILLPLGVATGTLYVALVLIGLWFPTQSAIIGLALIGVILTVVGYFLSDPGGLPWMVITNRGLSIIAIVITAILVTIHRKNTEKLLDYRQQVEDKATQLEAALKQEKEYGLLQQQFVSLVSHEFRTPLTIINSTAQRITRLKDTITPDQLVERSSKIRSAVDRMVGLIDTTLYAERIDAGKIEMHVQPCKIRELVEEVCNHQCEISPNHKIHVDLNGIPEQIMADPKLLEHVFTNLLSNAVKYAPDNPLIEVVGEINGDMALISIKDQGLGISKNDLPHMFERFFRAGTAEGIQGTGIGLSVCKQFVKMHGGTIEIVSKEGEGSTFTVGLPIDDAGQLI